MCLTQTTGKAKSSGWRNGRVCIWVRPRHTSHKDAKMSRDKGGEVEDKMAGLKARRDGSVLSSTR
jgi:hypothetical protein